MSVIKFGERIRELVDGIPDLAEIMEPLLAARQKLREQFMVLQGKLLSIVKGDPVCRRLMTVPEVGPVVALAFKATIDIPARFRNSKAVGPSLGLTPRLHQSGEDHRVGRVSLCGDAMMRTLLYETAQVLLSREEVVVVESVGDECCQRRGRQRATVALARRLAVIMHRIWIDGSEFRWAREDMPAVM